MQEPNISAKTAPRTLKQLICYAECELCHVHAEVGKAHCQGCVVQGQAICHSLCRGEWSREEHQPGKDCILAGAEQDEGVYLLLHFLRKQMQEQ